MVPLVTVMTSPKSGCRVGDETGEGVLILREMDVAVGLLDAAATAPAWPGGGHLNQAPILASARSSTEPVASNVTIDMASPLRDAVLCGRMLALGETGALEVRGRGAGMLDYQVRRSAK